MIKYEIKKPGEVWRQVQISHNMHPNIVSATMDQLGRQYPNHSIRALDGSKLVEVR